MKLIAGTRGSKLAIAQTKTVCNMLKDKYPHVDIDLKIISTKGDKILHKALDKIGDKGLFVKEIENQLIDGSIDFAVHSLKDMPSEIDDNLKLTMTPNRADARDVLIINPKHSIDTEKIYEWLCKSENLKIGTGSKRRIAQLLKINKKIQPMHIRGNIDTRISKLVSEDMDAIVLAAAGIERLNISNENMYFFEYEEMIPAAGQGALAIEIRKDNRELDKMFSEISDENSELEIIAERAFLKRINGGCHIPVGAISYIENGEFIISGIYGDEEYQNIVLGKKSIVLENILVEEHKDAFKGNDNISNCCKYGYEKIQLEKIEQLGIELADELVSKL